MKGSNELKDELYNIGMVDEVLAGLRAVEVPDGLEACVMLRVATVTARANEIAPLRVRLQARWGGLVSRPVWYGWGAVAALLVLGVMLIGRGRASHPSSVAPVPASMVPAAGSAASTNVVEVVPSTRTVDRAVRHDARRRPMKTTLVSFPAPEAPLTEQERLLLKLVRKEEPVALAKTDAVAEAENKAEFDMFFKPPPPPPQPKQEAVAANGSAPVHSETTVVMR